jgi:hypothetical protein
MANIVFMVAPSICKDGKPAYSTRGQLWDAFVDGEPIIERSTTPFVDAARVLLRKGVDGNTDLIMHHIGMGYDALRSTIGHAACQRVYDDSVGKPVFGRWREMPSDVVPPSHGEAGSDFGEVPATHHREAAE